MKTTRGFGFVAVLIIIGILALGGFGYYTYKHGGVASLQTIATTTENSSAGDGRIKQPVISWHFESAAEKAGIPYTNVSVTVNGKTQAVGSYQGSCSEVGASGGIDGKGLLAGELSAAQCYFAGGGDEIGVFANEDGGLELMTGGLSEGSAEDPAFRGNFKIDTNFKF